MPCFLAPYALFLLAALFLRSEPPLTWLARKILATVGILMGFGYAYVVRNSHEDIGVYGLVCGLLGMMVFIEVVVGKRTLPP